MFLVLQSPAPRANSSNVHVECGLRAGQSWGGRRGGRVEPALPRQHPTFPTPPASDFVNSGEGERGYGPGLRPPGAGFCPRLSSRLLELGRWVSPFPVPGICHLYKQGYSISLRDLCGVGEKYWIKPRNFVILKCLKFWNVLISVCLTAYAEGLLVYVPTWKTGCTDACRSSLAGKPPRLPKHNHVDCPAKESQACDCA